MHNFNNLPEYPDNALDVNQHTENTGYCFFCGETKDEWELIAGTCPKTQCQINLHYTWGEEAFLEYCDKVGENPEEWREIFETEVEEEREYENPKAKEETPQTTAPKIEQVEDEDDVADPEFAKLLKKTRIEKKLTQTDLAVKCNLTPAAISQFENATRKPSFTSVIKLSDALDCTTDYLIKGKNPEVPTITDTRILEIMEGFSSLPIESQEKFMKIVNAFIITHERNKTHAQNN